MCFIALIEIGCYNKFQTSPEIVSHQSSLRISYQLSYLRNSRVLNSLYLICIANITNVISSVQTQTNFFEFLFDQKSLAVVLEHRKSLDLVLDHRKSLS